MFEMAHRIIMEAFDTVSRSFEFSETLKGVCCEGDFSGESVNRGDCFELCKSVYNKCRKFVKEGLRFYMTAYPYIWDDSEEVSMMEEMGMDYDVPVFHFFMGYDGWFYDGVDCDGVEDIRDLSIFSEGCPYGSDDIMANTVDCTECFGDSVFMGIDITEEGVPLRFFPKWFSDKVLNIGENQLNEIKGGHYPTYTERNFVEPWHANMHHGDLTLAGYDWINDKDDIWIGTVVGAIKHVKTDRGVETVKINGPIIDIKPHPKFEGCYIYRIEDRYGKMKPIWVNRGDITTIKIRKENCDDMKKIEKNSNNGHSVDEMFGKRPVVYDGSESLEDKMIDECVRRVMESIVGSGARSKRTVINRFYRLVHPLTSSRFRDTDWSNVHMVFDAIGEWSDDIDVWVDGGGYGSSEDGMSKYKDWQFELEKDGFTLRGYLRASACGTVDDEWSAYDVTISVW